MTKHRQQLDYVILDKTMDHTFGQEQEFTFQGVSKCIKISMWKKWVISTS